MTSPMYNVALHRHMVDGAFVVSTLDHVGNTYDDILMDALLPPQAGITDMRELLPARRRRKLQGEGAKLSVVKVVM